MLRFRRSIATVGSAGRAPSPWGACRTALVLLGFLATCSGQGPTRAEPISTIDWDFSLGSGGWVAANTFITSPPPASPKWTWSAAGGMWSVDSAPVQSPAYRSGNYLTSPLIQLAPESPADKFTFTLVHRFKLPADGIPQPGYTLPVDAGQVTYSIDGNQYLPVPKADWTASGTLPAVLASLVQAPGFTVPQFVPGVAPVVSLPPLIDGGASFTGLSPGFGSGWFVASQAFQVDVPATTTTLRFRLTNMNLGQKCGLDAGWDVRFARVELSFAPEPDLGMIAATAGLLLAAGWAVRRRLGPHPLAAALRPLTTGPRVRA